MNKEEINEQYPQIVNYIVLAQNSRQGNIGQITSFIENSKNNEQKLEQWVEYWSKEDFKQTILIINGLRHVNEEQKDRLKQIIFDQIEKEKSRTIKIYKKLLILLYLEEFDKVEEIYKEYRIKIIEESKEENSQEKENNQKEENDKKEENSKNEENDKKEENSKKEENDKNEENDPKEENNKNEENDPKEENNKNEENDKNDESDKKETEQEEKDLKEEIKPKFLKNRYRKEKKYINTTIIKELHNSSNYKLILRYINILIKCGDYNNDIKKSIKLISKTINKKSQKDLIVDIVNTFIGRERINLVFDFLYNLKVRNYMEYIQSEYTEMDYIEMLNKMNEKKDPIQLTIQKDLFFNANYKKYGDRVLCTQKWFEYIEKRREKLDIIEIKHELSLLLECIYDDINLLDNNEFIKNKIDEISKTLEKENIKIGREANKETKYFETIMNILNKIISDRTDFKTKQKQIKQLKELNIFEYKENNKKEDMLYYYMHYRTMVNYSKKIFKEYMEEHKDTNCEELMYLYMNTHWKHTIPIEELLNSMEEQNIEISYEKINQYSFYGNIDTSKREQRIRFKNVLNINKARLIMTNLESNKRIYKFKIKIIGFNRIYKDLIIQTGEEITQNQIEYKQRNNNVWKKVGIYSSALEYKNLKTILGLNKEYPVKIDIHIVKKIAKTQIKIMEQFDTDLINILKQDKINPFKYVNSSEIKTNVHSKNINILKTEELLIKSCNVQYNEEIGILKEYYMQYVKEKYKELLEDKNNEIEDIIYYYMNTATRYIVNLNEFIELIAITKFKGQNEINIYNIFKDYPIVFKNINGNMVTDLKFLQAEKIIFYGLDFEKEIFDNKISYLSSKITMYNVKKNEIYINRFQKTSLIINSKEYEELVKLLINFLNQGNNEILKEIKSKKTVPELWLNNDSIIKHDYFITRDLEETCINIFTLLIEDDIEKLKTFIQALGNNNLFAYNRNVFRFGVRGDIKEYQQRRKSLKQNFLNQIKPDNIETVIYCYQNSFLKDLIRIEELIMALFIYNGEEKQLEGDGIIDIKDYNLSMSVLLIENTDNEVMIARRIKKYDDDLKVKFEVKDKTTNIKQLRITGYNTIYRTLYCEEIESIDYKRRRNYNIYYMRLVNKILKSNYPISKIIDFFKKSNIIYENAYYEKEDEDQYNYALKKSIFKKYLKRNFINYLKRNIKKKEINKNNIKMIYKMHSKSILKYIVTKNEMKNICKVVDNNKRW